MIKLRFKIKKKIDEIISKIYLFYYKNKTFFLGTLICVNIAVRVFLILFYYMSGINSPKFEI